MGKVIVRKKGHMPVPSAMSDEQITARLRAEIRAWQADKSREREAIRQMISAEMQALGLR